MKRRRSQSYSGLIWRQFCKSRLAVISLVFVGFMVFMAIFAPVIANDRPVLMKWEGEWYSPAVHLPGDMHGWDFKALHEKHPEATMIFPPIPYSPGNYDLDAILVEPSAAHILGTDGDGRDVAAQLIWGARISLSVGFVAVGIATIIGIILGAMAGYRGGWVDLVLSRIIEVIMCFPTFFLILAVLAFVGPSIYNIMIVIGITSWTGIARLVRADFLKFRNREFVVAARVTGMSSRRIAFRHILPNAMAPVLVSASFSVAAAILVESTLSFLGFGVPPSTPSWGSILSQAQAYMDIAWWLTLAPGFAIFLSITAYNLVGEGLRDAIDPQMRV